MNDEIIVDPVTENGNAYAGLFSQGLVAAGATVLAPSLRASLSADAAIVHWPESGTQGAFRIRDRVFLIWRLLLLVLLRARGRPLVWIVHNLSPHCPSFLGSLSYAAAERLCTHVGSLTESGLKQARCRRSKLRGKPGAVIEHGPYDVDASRSGPFTYDYLVLGSRPSQSDFEMLGVVLRRLGEDAPRVLIIGAGSKSENLPATSLPRLADSELAEAMESCRALLVIHQRFLHSGSIYLALSSGMPVVAPRQPVTQELSQTKQGIFLYDSLASGILAKDAPQFPILLPRQQLRTWRAIGEDALCLLNS